MQFKQSLLAAVICAVFAVAAPIVDLNIGGCPSTGTNPPAGAPASGPKDGSVSVSVPVNIGGVPSAGLPGGLPGDIPSAGSPSAGSPSAGLPVGGSDPGLGGIVSGLPGVGAVLSIGDDLPVVSGIPSVGDSGIPSVGDSGVSSVPGVSYPSGSPTWGAGAPGVTVTVGEPSGPSASAGVSATLSGSPVPGPPSSMPPPPMSTNLATSVYAPTSALPASTHHATSGSAPASAPQPTPAPSNPGSPNSPQHPGSGNAGGYGPGGSRGTCNTGTMQCCNSVQKSDSSDAMAIIGDLNIPTGSLTDMVGLTCSPISGEESCSATTVCCEDNSHGSLISMGCAPVIL